MKKKILVALIVLGMVFSLGNAWAKDSVKLNGVVNVNTASAEQLMLLPGVGEAKAKVIISARSQKSFSKKEDLLEIKGIGEKLIAKWNNHLAFSGQTSLKETEIK